MNIKQKILDIFPLIDWKGLNNTNYHRLRFYFDGKEESINNTLDTSIKILDDFLDKENIYICMTLYGNKRIKTNDISSLKKRKLYHIVKNYLYRYNIEYDDCTYFQYFSKINNKDILNLNKALIEKDYSISPPLYLNVYYIDLNQKIIVNLYDDRGMDIIAKDKLFIKKIYDKFNSYFNVKIEN